MNELDPTAGTTVVVGAAVVTVGVVVEVEVDEVLLEVDDVLDDEVLDDEVDEVSSAATGARWLLVVGVVGDAAGAGVGWADAP